MLWLYIAYRSLSFIAILGLWRRPGMGMERTEKLCGDDD